MKVKVVSAATQRGYPPHKESPVTVFKNGAVRDRGL